MQAAFAYLMAAVPQIPHLFHSHHLLCLTKVHVHRAEERPCGMNDTPFAVFLFLIDLNAIVFHVYQGSIGKKLVGEYRHVLAELHTWRTHIVALGEELSVNGFEEGGNGGVVVHPFGHYAVEIREAVL